MNRTGGSDARARRRSQPGWLALYPRGRAGVEAGLGQIRPIDGVRLSIRDLDIDLSRRRSPFPKCEPDFAQFAWAAERAEAVQPLAACGVEVDPAAGRVRIPAARRQIGSRREHLGREGILVGHIVRVAD